MNTQAAPGYLKKEKGRPRKFLNFLKEKIVKPVMMKISPKAYQWLEEHGGDIKSAIKWVNNKFIKGDKYGIISGLTSLIPGGAIANKAIQVVSNMIDTGDTKGVEKIFNDVLEGKNIADSISDVKIEPAPLQNFSDVKIEPAPLQNLSVPSNFIINKAEDDLNNEEIDEEIDDLPEETRVFGPAI